jgi:hypothetical protein
MHARDARQTRAINNLRAVNAAQQAALVTLTNRVNALTTRMNAAEARANSLQAQINGLGDGLAVLHFCLFSGAPFDGAVSDGSGALFVSVGGGNSFAEGMWVNGINGECIATSAGARLGDDTILKRANRN